MTFALANMNAPDLQALLKLHLGEAFQDACSAAFDAKRLSEPDVDLYSLRNASGDLLGMAALKTLADGTGEVKSVRTHPDYLRQGIAHKLMDGIEAEARRRGMTAIRLETHPTPAYAAACKLYEARDYTYCGPFAGYEDTGNSVFMELWL